jgi:hypothetical protein
MPLLLLLLTRWLLLLPTPLLHQPLLLLHSNTARGFP